MNRQKQKGDRFEREVVKELQQCGLEATRTCLITQAGQKKEDQPGDILISAPGLGYSISLECKSRSNVFSGTKTINKWKGNNDAILLKEDRKNPVLVIDWKVFCDLINCLIDQSIEEEDKKSCFQEL